MKKSYFSYSILLCLCAVLSTCKHEPEIDPNSSYCGEATTIDEMMEWVYFKTGTYWIYEEQNSGALDTMTVYFDYSGVSNTGNREFVVKMESSLDGYTYEYWFNDAWSGECGTREGCFCRVVDCEKYIPGDFVGGNHVFIFPLFVDNRAGQHGQDLDFGYSTIAENTDTLILSGISFLNVYGYSFDYSVQHDYESAEYNLAKNIGIIQKKINSINENWELIEYAINQ